MEVDDRAAKVRIESVGLPKVPEPTGHLYERILDEVSGRLPITAQEVRET